VALILFAHVDHTCEGCQRRKQVLRNRGLWPGSQTEHRSVAGLLGELFFSGPATSGSTPMTYGDFVPHPELASLDGSHLDIPHASWCG
jgi:hypothetical protein